MLYLYTITGLALLISVIMDRRKTLAALRIAWRKFIGIAPAFSVMLIMVSIILFLVPDETISNYLGRNEGFVSVITAALFGSITIMPGFIAFPLCGILLEKGVGYMVLAAFTTTLMMVGILTYPVEKEYFGAKVTVIRNAISFLIAIIVALAIGFFFGEL